MSKNEPLLFIIGSSHEQANLEERETFSLKDEEADLLADDLLSHPSIDECLVLNTCNRLEIYAVSNQAHPINEIHQFYLLKLPNHQLFLNICVFPQH